MLPISCRNILVVTVVEVVLETDGKRKEKTLLPLWRQPRKHVNITQKNLLESNLIVSNWNVTYWQPYIVTSRQSNAIKLYPSQTYTLNPTYKYNIHICITTTAIPKRKPL